ncbi:SDR family oxidoreductase [Corticibacterium sp. UT-5YL-CI-8]|nr:SDR family oxidoreductase [Tianweitania sp. UT-5YL-CI-8]
MAREFEGKSVLVTGSASGIGAAIALQLAEEGAFVVVADHDSRGAQRIVKKIHDAGGEAKAFKVDVTHPSEVHAAVTFTVEAYGALNCAVNNAGISGPNKPTTDYTVKEWQRVIDTNLNSVFYGLKYQIPAIIEAGGGSIVNMSSILGSNGFANAPAYVTTKHALVGMTKSSALEYASQGVRINAVGPGFIETPLLTRKSDPETMEHLSSLHPIGRLGRAEEVAALACFLLSDRASFITGSYHLVDGGYSAQ